MQRPNNVHTQPSAVTPVVQALLVLNGLMFILQMLNVLPLERLFALWPLGVEDPRYGSFWPGQLVTYGFLHASVAHIFFNMFALWMFGSTLERLWGSRPFLLFYMVCVVGAGAIQLFVTSHGVGNGYIAPTIGASGGVFGILLGFGMMYPNRMVVLIFPPIPMKAKYFVILYGLLELYLGVTDRQPTVAHFAHLGGMVFGLVLILYWRGKLPIKPRRRLNR